MRARGCARDAQQLRERTQEAGARARSHDVFDIPVMQNDEVDLAVVAVSHMTCQPLTACHPQ